MTEQQAYAAMFFFLDRLYDRTKSDELGGLLGSMSPLADGMPADPAIKEDWREAVAQVRQNQEPEQLSLKKQGIR